MKVAIYCRLSEEDRNKQFETDDSNSIQNQKSMLLQYAMEQGWELYNIYSDDDYTGSDRRRPAGPGGRPARRPVPQSGTPSPVQRRSGWEWKIQMRASTTPSCDKKFR